MSRFLRVREQPRRGIFCPLETDVKDFSIILFDGFEPLDAFGPAEIIGETPDDYALQYFSQNGGIVESHQNIKAVTRPFCEMDRSGILLIPGGNGTRTLAADDQWIEQLKDLSDKAPYVLSVCTGSALLAKAGLSDGRKATSNKMVFSWAASQGTAVK